MANGGGGVAHQEVEAAWKGTLAGHELGRVSAMVRSLHELEWRKEKGEEKGFARRGGVRAAMSQKKKKEGGPVWVREQESRADRVWEKERKRTM